VGAVSRPPHQAYDPACRNPARHSSMILTIDPEALSAPTLYKVLSGLIIPRPIALITTMSDSGLVNAAPYSFFNILSDKPPVIGVGIANKPTGELKDTARHIESRRELVVNLVRFDM